MSLQSLEKYIESESVSLFSKGKAVFSGWTWKTKILVCFAAAVFLFIAFESTCSYYDSARYEKKAEKLDKSISEAEGKAGESEARGDAFSEESGKAEQKAREKESENDLIEEKKEQIDKNASDKKKHRNTVANSPRRSNVRGTDLEKLLDRVEERGN